MPWSSSNRRARLPKDWRRRRAAVLRRDGGICCIQGPDCTGYATEVDHIVPNDDHSIANLQATCHACHAAKTSLESPRRPSTRRAPEAHPGLR